MDIYLASGNAHKLEEIQALLDGLPITLHSANSLGGMPDVDENAPDMPGNARLKAQALLALAPANAWVLADDSGLCVKALFGAPGVRSARFAGENATDADNNAKLLDALKIVPSEKRLARFVCVFCLLSTDGEHLFQGELLGRIADAPRGTEGFGYDPLFIPKGYEQTLAELGPDIKNTISHRAAAAASLKKWLSGNSTE